jgi:hypothetical protein
VKRWPQPRKHWHPGSILAEDHTGSATGVFCSDMIANPVLPLSEWQRLVSAVLLVMALGLLLSDS